MRVELEYRNLNVNGDPNYLLIVPVTFYIEQIMNRKLLKVMDEGGRLAGLYNNPSSANEGPITSFPAQLNVLQEVLKKQITARPEPFPSIKP